MPATRRWFGIAGPLAVTVLAAVLRLWNLGNPHHLVFDETYYVKDAWTLFNNGYESAWPPEADPRFEAGEVDIFSADASFVVHPPLGKWLITLGMAALGPDSSWGWRISTAVIGVLAVVLLMLIARALFNSAVLTIIAGFLFAVDGHAIVLARVALLDNSVMFFTLLGFGAVLLDRRRHETRLAAWLATRRESGGQPGWGPALWWRPWLLVAGLAFGLACSVKWSGAYVLAAFGIYVVVVDALARRRLGVPFWMSAAVLKQGPVSFLLIVPVAVLTFLTSWTGWFVTAGGFYRQWADLPGAAWTGPLAWVPRVIQSFWHYQSAAYTYHVNAESPHPYQSSPLTWLLMIRPTSMYYRGTARGEDGCAFDACAQAINSVGNPLVWWAAAAAVLVLCYRFVRRPDWRVGLILVGLAAGYLPWLLYLDRTVYQFYAIAFEPYLILALTYVIGLVLRAGRNDPERRGAGVRVVVVYLVAVLLVSAFFYPLWAGAQVPFRFWQLHFWLPSWR